MGKKKYIIGDICSAGIIVGEPINSRYLVKCITCESIRRVQASHTRCKKCYESRDLKYEVGKKTPEGLMIYGVDRSNKTGIKLFIECSLCKTKVWKWLSSLHDVCISCKNYESSLKLANKKIVNKIGSYRSSATRRGYIWSLSHKEAQLLFLSECAYCGISGKIELNGIDRVNNNKGYFLENCVSCCASCNYAKGSKTVEDWNFWLDRVTKFRS